AADHVFKTDGFVKRYFNPDYMGLPPVQKCLGFGFRKAERVAQLKPIFVAIPGVGMLFALCFQFLGSVKCIVSITVGYQLLGILPVHGLPLPLPVRAISTAMDWTLVRCQAAPLQAILDIRF